jgi:hypothetical protein
MDEAAFGAILVGIVLVGALVAALSYVGSGNLYKQIGKLGGLALDEPDRPAGPKLGSAAAKAEAEMEIRQMLEAKSARREARGETPLDIEAELAALTTPAPAAHDEELREEVRQLVIARNERRMRRGEEPLDVESEVDRQLRELGG